MDGWYRIKAADFVDFNPCESIPKNKKAKKIAMERLQPFTRDVAGYEVVPFSGGTKFRNGDTIMARITPCLENGKTAQIDFLDGNEVGFGSTEFIVMRAKRNISDANFIYYLATSPFFREIAIQSMVGSSGRQRVQQGVLDATELYVPPLPEQIEIGRTLRTLDDKIANNAKINHHLEQMAKAIFKSWFVDFEPFDEPFVEMPNGIKAPNSLLMQQVADIPHVLETGKRPKGGAVSSGIPSIGAENVKELGVVNIASIKYIPNDFAAKMKTGEIKGYELLLYKDGGKPGTFTPHFSMFGEGFPFDIFYINEHVFKLDFGNSGYNIFAYLYMQTDYPYNWLANNGGKAAIPGINQHDVNSIWIFTPENPQVKKFCDMIQPYFTQIFTNCKQNMKLAKLRDCLLPRLMSGELSVADYAAK